MAPLSRPEILDLILREFPDAGGVVPPLTIEELRYRVVYRAGEEFARVAVKLKQLAYYCCFDLREGSLVKGSCYILTYTSSVIDWVDMLE